MIKIENIDVYGFETAIRGMRNPMNSWDRSDSKFHCDDYNSCNRSCMHFDTGCNPIGATYIGDNDIDLMQRLFKAGTEHRKYLRFINVTMDITAPLYWWKEFDTYKIGTNCNSCSTMHKIHAKEFELDDFSHEHLSGMTDTCLENVIDCLNRCRKGFVTTKDKRFWWQMIQLLPTSYNQRRTVQMNYEVAVRMIEQRKNHKLDEWHVMVEELLKLPYMKEIVGLVE